MLSRVLERGIHLRQVARTRTSIGRLSTHELIPRRHVQSLTVLRGTHAPWGTEHGSKQPVSLQRTCLTSGIPSLSLSQPVVYSLRRFGKVVNPGSATPNATRRVSGSGADYYAPAAEDAPGSATSDVSTSSSSSSSSSSSATDHDRYGVEEGAMLGLLAEGGSVQEILQRLHEHHAVVEGSDGKLSAYTVASRVRALQRIGHLVTVNPEQEYDEEMLVALLGDLGQWTQDPQRLARRLNARETSMILISLARIYQYYMGNVEFDNGYNDQVLAKIIDIAHHTVVITRDVLSGEEGSGSRVSQAELANMAWGTARMANHMDHEAVEKITDAIFNHTPLHNYEQGPHLVTLLDLLIVSGLERPEHVGSIVHWFLRQDLSQQRKVSHLSALNDRQLKAVVVNMLTYTMTFGRPSQYGPFLLSLCADMTQRMERYGVSVDLVVEASRTLSYGHRGDPRYLRGVLVLLEDCMKNKTIECLEVARLMEALGAWYPGFGARHCGDEIHKIIPICLDYILDPSSPRGPRGDDPATLSPEVKAISGISRMKAPNTGRWPRAEHLVRGMVQHGILPNIDRHVSTRPNLTALCTAVGRLRIRIPELSEFLSAYCLANMETMSQDELRTVVFYLARAQDLNRAMFDAVSGLLSTHLDNVTEDNLKYFAQQMGVYDRRKPPVLIDALLEEICTRINRGARDPFGLSTSGLTMVEHLGRRALTSISQPKLLHDLAHYAGSSSSNINSSQHRHMYRLLCTLGIPPPPTVLSAFANRIERNDNEFKRMTFQELSRTLAYTAGWPIGEHMITYIQDAMDHLFNQGRGWKMHSAVSAQDVVLMCYGLASHSDLLTQFEKPLRKFIGSRNQVLYTNEQTVVLSYLFERARLAPVDKLLNMWHGGRSLPAWAFKDLELIVTNREMFDEEFQQKWRALKAAHRHKKGAKH